LKTVVLPVQVMRCINVKLVIVTNAAGGLNPNFEIGDVMGISDSIALPQLCGMNSLMGPNDAELGPRFQPVSNGYPEALRDVAQRAADALGFDFFHKTGTYCFVTGPMYESKAECKFLRELGGHAVGMSTIPEVTAAHHSGMKVLGLSLITNKVVMPGDDSSAAASHEEVIDAVNKRSQQMQSFVKKIVEILKTEVLPTLPALKAISLTVPVPSILEGLPIQSILFGAAAVAVGIFIGKARSS
jgi:purine-nucleoside phosphorylase